MAKYFKMLVPLRMTVLCCLRLEMLIVIKWSEVSFYLVLIAYGIFLSRAMCSYCNSMVWKPNCQGILQCIYPNQLQVSIASVLYRLSCLDFNTVSKYSYDEAVYMLRYCGETQLALNPVLYVTLFQARVQWVFPASGTVSLLACSGSIHTTSYELTAMVSKIHFTYPLLPRWSSLVGCVRTYRTIKSMAGCCLGV